MITSLPANYTEPVPLAPAGLSQPFPGRSSSFQGHPSRVAQSPQTHTGSAPLTQNFGQYGPDTHNVTNALPGVSTPGLRTGEASQPSAGSAAADPLENLQYPELTRKGEEQLSAAKEAYTTYGQMTLAQQARGVLQQFDTVCQNHNGNISDLVAALKAIGLPANGLAITIQYPDNPVLSLIPPDEKNLKDASVGDIKKWYQMAYKAMDTWANENASAADALQKAKTDLDSAVATLKTIREAIDRKVREQMNQPGNSQLEVQYQAHVDKGVSISNITDELSLSAHGPVSSPDLGR